VSRATISNSGLLVPIYGETVRLASGLSYARLAFAGLARGQGCAELAVSPYTAWTATGAVMGVKMSRTHYENVVALRRAGQVIGSHRCIEGWNANTPVTTGRGKG
jgi:hypothetical protein